MGSLSLLQQIFRIQESNPGLLHCRQILHQLSYQGVEKGNIQIQLIPDILSHIVWGKKKKNLRNSCEVYSQEQWVPKRLRLNPGTKG